MTTNIDELITDLYEQRMISDSEVVALRSQQKRIEELEKVNIELSAALVVELERVHAIRQVVKKVQGTCGGFNFIMGNAQALDEIAAILSTVKDAPAQQPASKPSVQVPEAADWLWQNFVSIRKRMTLSDQIELMGMLNQPQGG